MEPVGEGLSEMILREDPRASGPSGPTLRAGLPCAFGVAHGARETADTSSVRQTAADASSFVVCLQSSDRAVWSRKAREQKL